MDQLSFGLPSTGSDIHFTWSGGMITLSDKFTGDIRLADGDCIRIEDGKWIYRTFGECKPAQIQHVCPSCGVGEGDVCDPSCDARKERVAMYVAEKASMEGNVIVPNQPHYVWQFKQVDSPGPSERAEVELRIKQAERLPHPCVQNVVAGEDIGAGQFVQMKGEGPLRAAYRCFKIAEDMREAMHEHFSMYAFPAWATNQSSCKCASLLHGHEPGCPIQGK